MAIAHGPSSKRPRRPAAAGPGGRAASPGGRRWRPWWRSALGLKTRTWRAPASRVIALTSAPVTPSACPAAGPVAAAPPPRVTRQRQEGVVDDGVGIAPAQVDGEARLDPVLRLRALHRRERSGRQGPGGHRALRQHPRAPQQRDGERARGGLALVEVDQLVLEQTLVGDGEPAGGHEAPRRVGGQPLLGGAALGGEAALDGARTRTRPPRWWPARAGAGGPGAGGRAGRGCRARRGRGRGRRPRAARGWCAPRPPVSPTRASPSTWVGSS